MNQTGGFVMEAGKVGRDTMLSQIVRMVADAQRSRAPIQRLADEVSGWFVPVREGLEIILVEGDDLAGPGYLYCAGIGGLKARYLRIPNQMDAFD
jgi:Cu+-exporting ATPase